jgi:hypothetical protein
MTLEHPEVYQELRSGQSSPPLFNTRQALLTIPAVPLYPSFYLLLLPPLARLFQQCTHSTALVCLIKQPVLIFCFYYFLLDAVHNTQGN